MSDANIRYVGPRHFVVGNNPTPLPYWEPGPRISKAIIFGGGPSHNEIASDIIIDNGFRIFAINSACRGVQKFARLNDVLYFSDNGWAEKYLDLITSWPGIAVTSNRNAKARLGNLINRIKIEDLVNFIEIKSDHVYASSGHTAAILAAFMGAKKIILLGFECKEINGRSHGHQDYRQSDVNVFRERFIPGWNNLAVGFREKDIEVINSTPDSEVKCFPYLDFEKAIKC